MSDETPVVPEYELASTKPDLIAQAIAALTAVARTTRVIGQGTPNEHNEPVDFAEIACQVITSVAANVGSVETLLAGRSGSWEADYVRRIVQSTAGEDDTELMRYRTEPIWLQFDVLDRFHDFGLEALYDEAVEELYRRETVAEEALFESVATPEEKERLAVCLQALTNSGLFVELDPTAQKLVEERTQEVSSINEAVYQRGQRTGNPLREAVNKAATALENLEDLWERDQGAYRESYTASAREVLIHRGLTLDVEPLGTDDEEVEWDPFTDALHEYARKSAPLPMTGEAPDWTDGTPADALRRAGLTYIARVQGTV
ncbi:hypothetical protein [Arthrobacter glacialis]|uniref:hypothetical protein n=1 Tax=Arthrobacter glacialis TaxID=1664 RepID=UPI001A9C6437|nr:hypothetical protein [Arthrobacter glacialis]